MGYSIEEKEMIKDVYTQLNPTLIALETKEESKELDGLPLSTTTRTQYRDKYVSYTSCIKKSFWDEQKEVANYLGIPMIQYVLKSMLFMDAVGRGEIKVESININPKLKGLSDGDKETYSDLKELKEDVKTLDKKFDLITTLLGGKAFASN